MAAARRLVSILRQATEARSLLDRRIRFDPITFNSLNLHLSPSHFTFRSRKRPPQRASYNEWTLIGNCLLKAVTRCVVVNEERSKLWRDIPRERSGLVDARREIVTCVAFQRMRRNSFFFLNGISISRLLEKAKWFLSIYEPIVKSIWFAFFFALSSSCATAS